MLGERVVAVFASCDYISPNFFALCEPQKPYKSGKSVKGSGFNFGKNSKIATKVVKSSEIAKHIF